MNKPTTRAGYFRNGLPYNRMGHGPRTLIIFQGLLFFENKPLPARLTWIYDRYYEYLEETYGIFQNRERFDVTIRFSPERARWVKDEIWHPEQVVEEQEDGYYLMTIPVSHHTEIFMEILKHGAQVEILSPDWLRAKLVEEARSLVELYGS